VIVGIIVFGFFVLGFIVLAWLATRFDFSTYPTRLSENEGAQRTLTAHNILVDIVKLLLDEKVLAAHELSISIDRTRLDPVDLELLDALQAWVYANLDRHDEALICAHAATKAADPVVQTFAGATLARLESFAEASPLLRRALMAAELEPSARALGLFHLGVAERGQGRFDEARDAGSGFDPSCRIVLTLRARPTNLRRSRSRAHIGRSAQATVRDSDHDEPQYEDQHRQMQGDQYRPRVHHERVDVLGREHDRTWPVVSPAIAAQLALAQRDEVVYELVVVARVERHGCNTASRARCSLSLPRHGLVAAT
jgi:hypothetical protein